MTTQYTPILQLALPVTGELNGTWGDVVNDNITSMVEEAIAGLATISTWTTNAHTLTTADGVTDEARCAMLVLQTGSGGTALSAAGQVICPARTKLYVVKNDAAYAVTVKTSGGSGVAIAAGDTAFVFCDGTNVNACVTQIINGHITGNLTVDGNTTLGDSSADTVTINAGSTTINDGGAIRFEDNAGGEYVAIKAPATVTATYTLTLPIDDGTNGQALITDGSGNLSWSTAASGDVYGPASATDTAVALFDGTTGKLIKNSVVTVSSTGDVAGVDDISMSGAITLSGGTANGVAYLNGSKVLTTGSALTFDGTTLNFGGTAQRITGDFSNATLSNRTLFQTNAANTYTLIEAIPSGSGNLSIFTAYNSSDPANSSTMQLSCRSTEARIGTGINGTGSYLPMTFYTNGTEQMRLTSTGLGIGTSSPSVKLHVAGGSSGATPPTNVVGVFENSAASGISILSPDANAGRIYFGTASNAQNAYIYSDYNSGAQTLIFGVGSSTTTATEKMRLDSSGNLGLGVTPSAWGSNRKAIDFENYSCIASSVGAYYGLELGNNFYNNAGYKYKVSSQPASLYQTYNGGHYWSTAPSGTAGNAITFTQAMTLDASGNLKVGTTVTPNGKLIVNNGTNKNIQLRGSIRLTGSSIQSLQDDVTTDSPLEIYTGSAQIQLEGTPLTFLTSATERMRIDSSGRVGIGTSSPAFPLDVAGSGGAAIRGGQGFNLYNSDNTNNYYLYNSGSSGAGNATLVITQGGVAERMRIDSSGNVGIGTSSPSSYITGLAVNPTTNGSAIAAGNGAWISGFSSDAAFANASLSSGGVWYAKSAGAGIMYASSSGYLGFYTNSGLTAGNSFSATERMRIDSSGNVGIGTSSAYGRITVCDPAQSAGSNPTTFPSINILQGSASLNSNGGLDFRGSSFGNGYGFRLSAIDSSGVHLVFGNRQNATTFTEVMRIDATGNVTIAQAGRATITTDNDGSFDMNAASNFKCTPTGTFALTFTNIASASGQSGYILLVNTGGYAITAAATTKVGSSFLSTVSTAGTYLLSYFSDATNVYVTTSGALS